MATLSDLALVEEVFTEARKRDLICVFTYDGNAGWYVAFDSAAPSERWVGKTHHSPQFALEVALEHLRK
jgi:hypothetical protein